MATYYAWSNFVAERNEWGQTTKMINAGDKVSQSDLEGVSDEEWQYLIETGAVREDPYPEDLPPNQSPAEYYAANPEEAEKAAEEQDVATAPQSPQAPGKPSPSQGPQLGEQQKK